MLNGDQYADMLVSHLYRWISSPAESKLYDPLLHRLIHKLMKKNFFQLLYRLKELGCNVIFANFHKVIINTERTTVDAAENFIAFVLETIKQKPLFAFIQLTPVEYWRILLFKDWYNYGGIKEGSGEKKVVAKWDVALHLPEAVQRKFLLTVSEFILKVFRYNQKLMAQEQSGIPMEEELIEGGGNQEDKVVSYMDAVEDFKKGKDH